MTLPAKVTTNGKRGLAIIAIVLLSFFVRAGTAQFIGERLTETAWFQSGSYADFDQRAQNVLDGKESFFWIHDASRTDLIKYPPAFPLFVAVVYELSGERSSYAVHRVVWILDAFSLLLIVGIGVTAFGWRAGFAGGALAALSPLLALYGVSPAADAPTTWFVLAGVWMLLLTAKRLSWRWALGAGLMLGAACWFRVNPLFLAFCWAAALLFVLQAGWRTRMWLSAVMLFAAMAIVAPVAIRNIVVYREFVPTGLNVGTNFWEGLGETEYGRSLGFECNDIILNETERAELGYPPDLPMTLVWPDGIRRDRERTRKSLAIIAAHPVWYAGVMARRMAGMLTFVGSASPYYGSTGVTCSGTKCLPPAWQGAVLAVVVNLLGAIQFAFRFLALPLMLVGILLAFRRDRQMTLLLLATVFYYLVPGTAVHTEIRYGLPMQAVLLVFAGLAVCRLADTAFSIIKRRHIDTPHNETGVQKI